MIAVYMVVKDFLLDYKWGIQLKRAYSKLFESYNRRKYPITAIQNLNRRYYVVCKDPIIIFTFDRVHDLEEYSKEIADEKVFIFNMFAGTLLFDPYRIKQLKDSYHRHCKLYPKHRIIFLSNTEEERDLISSITCDVCFVSHNAFLDENIYKIEGVGKERDAIYNGRLNASKRHYLLPRGYSIDLVAAHTLNLKNELKYLKWLCSKIPEYKVLNYKPARKLKNFEINDFEMPLLESDEVVTLINQSRVGVILSATEGANYASIEYLLCGIPVLSTVSLGGRDLFLNNEYSRIVKSNRRAIKEGLEDLLEKNYDQQAIRASALKDLEAHRMRFFEVLKELFDQEGIKLSPQDFWAKFFKNKMADQKPFPSEFIKDLQKAPSLKEIS